MTDPTPEERAKRVLRDRDDANHWGDGYADTTHRTIKEFRAAEQAAREKALREAAAVVKSKARTIGIIRDYADGQADNAANEFARAIERLLEEK